MVPAVRWRSSKRAGGVKQQRLLSQRSRSTRGRRRRVVARGCAGFIPADLDSKRVGCLVENATHVDVLAATGELVNDRGYGSLRDDPILG